MRPKAILLRNYFGKLDAPGIIRTQEQKAVCSNKIELNTSPFLVNALINDITILQALVDNGCSCSGIINAEVSNKLQLLHIAIVPRRLQTVEMSTENKLEAHSITYITLDLDGHVTPKLWLYVVPHSTHDLILGKKWLEDLDAIIHSKEQKLELREAGRFIYRSKVWRQRLRNFAQPRITPATVMVSIIKEVTVCKISLEDINKELRSKPNLTLKEARQKLPYQAKVYAYLFADDRGAEHLPPSRASPDHAINPRQENRKALTPPWGSLYNMTREELLVLRKTLTDFLK